MNPNNPRPAPEYFHFVNRHPEGLRESGCAASAVNAASIITGEPWQNVFQKLLKQAHDLCLMPEDDRCVRGMLRACGFVRQPSGFPGGENPQQIRGYLQETVGQGVTAIVRVPHYGYGGYMLAILPGDDGEYILAGCEPRTAGEAEDVWLRWPDGEDHSPVARRTGKGAVRMREYRIPDSHREYQYHQENPGNHFIRDCVVRGIASACGITWHEAVDQLGSHGYTAINNRIAYKRVLADNGFVKQTPLRRGGRYLSGVEFCEEVSRIFRQGEAIFAHVGRNHVAAILPQRRPDGKFSYRIMDTWDSSDRSITDWWVQPPENAPKKKEKPKPDSAEIGDRVKHPSFGTGTVQSVTGTGPQAILEIRFASAGVKKLARRWVLEHCTVEKEEKKTPAL